MVAAVSVTCGNVEDGTGDIRAKIDAVHIRVDGAPVYNADGTQKRYRLRIIPATAANENDVSSGYSHLFAPDANGDHQWDGYIFPAADDYDIILEDEEQAASDAINISGAATVANPSVITTASPHGLQTGEEVTIDGTTGYTPDIDGTHVVTVVDDDQFSIPVNVTVAGTGGTIQSSGAIDRTTVTVV